MTEVERRLANLSQQIENLVLVMPANRLSILDNLHRLVGDVRLAYHLEREGKPIEYNGQCLPPAVAKEVFGEMQRIMDDQERKNGQ